ncbi:DUF2794 domain-containing protein [Marinibaculum pumilum]|uniref:DUF2794 domain-containing protein n=1 Tax=Marinibaculum pumilum TaxID=1766165 RepID=A0ABV7KYA5_9PROT
MADIVTLDSYRGGDAGGQGASHPAGQKSAQNSGQKGQNAAGHVFFDRREFDLILRLYGVMVAAGEWRDYAIGHDAESCTFAVFRRSADGALYRIVKTPKLAKKQGAYAVLGADGRVMKRGRSLAQTLGVFERKVMKLVEAE